MTSIWRARSASATNRTELNTVLGSLTLCGGCKPLDLRSLQFPRFGNERDLAVAFRLFPREKTLDVGALALTLFANE